MGALTLVAGTMTDVMGVPKSVAIVHSRAMNALRLLPVVLSAVLIAAHYLRAGSLATVALCLVAPMLLLLRRAWVPRLMQGGLAFAAIVWVWTAWDIVQLRMAVGAPWTTAAIILGSVAAWTAGSALIFETAALRKRYGRPSP